MGSHALHPKSCCVFGVGTLVIPSHSHWPMAQSPHFTSELFTQARIAWEGFQRSHVAQVFVVVFVVIGVLFRGQGRPPKTRASIAR